MQEQTIDGTIARTFVYTGVALVLSLVVTQGWLMGFIPPPSPALPAEELAKIFIDRKMSIRIGTLIQCICYTFWFTWAISIAFYIRRMERGIPVLTYASIANIGGGYVFFLLMPITWAALAFRPENLDPNVLQVMNDLVWFIFILSWPPFALFMVFIAVAIFRDHNVPTIFPRWVAFFNLWTAVLIIPAGLIEFFKTGPFAYDGLISFWFVFAVFFGWMLVMSIVTLRAIAVDARAAARP
ncbi:hypothetical protein [Zavarzinia compransoris]|uniref:DUF4386 domain-containing protein n=1 Tax=Zavarzinia compransoris TaxID=1264899 RepID=A0A317E410_9PROT|nr:hypothetical protein [Zavarzinia compransoris]PWR20950.1 hypothetical protein DKG75_13245 [Zavarzinia compransoris]TDP43978.1 hypothetical protein DES42_10824 [Zavarzinia compransoris]